MIDRELVRALIFSAPLICSIICLVMAMLDTGRSKHPVHRKIHYHFIITYGVFSLIWLGFVLHSISHSAFIHYIPLFFPAVMFCYILNYRSICTMTDTGDGQTRFPWTHFLAPGILSLLILVTTLTLSHEKLNEIVYNPGGNAIRYIFLGICLVYNSIIYRIICLSKIWNYRRKNTSDPKDSHSRILAWMFWLMVVDLIVLPLPAFGLLLGMDIFENLSFLWLIPVLPSLSLCVIACYNLLSENYVILEPDAPAAKGKESNGADNVIRLSRERVENYISAKKPYLNPAYRITDMAEDLFTNRAYISSFINKEYGMNFNRFVNGYRLHEVERLREEAAGKRERVPVMQLIMNAGFSNYRSYLRAKEAAADTPPNPS